jgi:hypothetical protein
MVRAQITVCGLNESPTVKAVWKEKRQSPNVFPQRFAQRRVEVRRYVKVSSRRVAVRQHSNSILGRGWHVF